MLLLILTLCITIKFKISLHSVAISGLAGGFLALSIVMKPIYNLDFLIQLNAILLIIMGLVASSRLILKAHSVQEVLLGMTLGFVIEFIVVINQIYTVIDKL